MIRYGGDYKFQLIGLMEFAFGGESAQKKIISILRLEDK